MATCKFTIHKIRTLQSLQPETVPPNLLTYEPAPIPAPRLCQLQLLHSSVESIYIQHPSKLASSFPHYIRVQNCEKEAGIKDNRTQRSTSFLNGMQTLMQTSARTAVLLSRNHVLPASPGTGLELVDAWVRCLAPTESWVAGGGAGAAPDNSGGTTMRAVDTGHGCSLCKMHAQTRASTAGGQLRQDRREGALGSTLRQSGHRDRVATADPPRVSTEATLCHSHHPPIRLARAE